MSDRVDKIIESGEALRQFDIELAVMEERNRIIELLLDGWLAGDSPVIAAIKGEKE